jgi:hypothetical protein
MSEPIQLMLSRRQFQELIELVYIGGYVRNAVKESEETYDVDCDNALEQVLYDLALVHSIPGIKKTDSWYVGPSREHEQKLHGVIREFEDESFWNELEVRLGKRDFERSMTPVEWERIQKSDWLPERVYTYYEKYDVEFTRYGIERLEVDTNAPVAVTRNIV